MKGVQEVFFEIKSKLTEDKIGYTGMSLDTDQYLNIFGSVNFFNKPVNIFKFNYNLVNFDW